MQLTSQRTLEMKLAAFISGSLASLVRQDNSIKSWADNLKVDYKVLNNFVKSSNTSYPWPNSDAFDFSVTLRNDGPDTITGSIPWAIYFYQDQVIFNEVNTEINMPVDIGQGLNVQHVNGYLWKFVKNDNWNNLKTGEERTWNLQGDGWIVADSTLFPNWYFACEDDSCYPAVIKSTESVTWNKPDYVQDFLKDNQRYRYERDQAETITPLSQWENNDGLKLKDSDGNDITTPYYSLPVLPLPSFVEMQPNSLQLIDGVPQPSAGIKINLDYWEVQYKEDTGYLPNQERCTSEQKPCTCNIEGSGYEADKDCNCPFLTHYQEPGGKCPEGGCPSLYINVGANIRDLAWRASMDTASATLFIKDCESIKGATDFFSKLVQKLNSKSEYYDKDAMLFKGMFGDKPKPQMDIRAVFLDHSRHFHGVEPVKKLLKHMSMLNLNQLHMRMSDDEGWRIEVTDIPELGKIGGSRCHDLKGDQCIMPQLGSGPEKGGGAGSGYITRAQYKEILKIATDYGIRIVPEIVAPGHNAAAIQAMHWYEKNNNDPQYRLTDPDQEESGFSVQGFYDNVMNPCMDSTFTFLQKVVGQFKEDHEDYKQIQNHFHIGGDETNVGLIKGSPICRQKMKDEGLDFKNDDDVNAYFHKFFQKYVKMVGEAGFHVHGWEEVWEYEESPDIFKIYDKAEWDVPAGIDLYAYHWNNMWLMGDGPTTGHMMANAGYKLIMSPATHLYLDHAQYEHPHSRGLMWATRSSNLTKVFSFRPFDFYRNGLTYIDGNKIDNGCEPGTTENGDSWDCYPLTEEGRKNVVGMEACLWSEEVVEEKHIWEQMFPRVFALAQRSWAETTWEETTGSSWDIFKNTTFKADWLRFRYALQFKLRELEQDGMWYDLPKPGMKEVDSNSWSFNTLYYHNPVMLRNPNSTDDSWKPYSIVKEEIKDNDDDNRNVEIVTTSFSMLNSGQPRRTSQPYQVTMKRPETPALHIKSWADNLQVEYKVLNNFVKSSNISYPWPNSDAFDFCVTLKNKGPETINGSIPWAIYFYQDQVIFNEANIEINRPVDIGQGLNVQHVNGYLWKFVKNDNWNNLKTGEERTWNLQGDGWIVADSTLFPNWYFACEDDSCYPAVIKSTESVTWNKPDYVHEFLEDNQRYRYERDQAATITPLSQWENNDGLKLKNENGYDVTKPYYSLPVLPLPSFVEMDPNNLQLIDGVPQPSAGIKINLDYWELKYTEDPGYLPDDAPQCTNDQRPCTCSKPGTGDQPDEDCDCPFLTDYQERGGKCPEGGCPSLSIVVGTNVKDLAWRAQMDTASATLFIKDCESIKGATDFFSKLVQKLNSESEYYDKNAMLFKGIFGDKPKPQMETRAVFLDHSRHFHGVEPVKKLLKHMSMLNLNQLHMRMSDDEGWRIEVTDIPELGKIGGSRCHDLKGDQCIMPQLGSGPEKGGGAGSGYITRAQYKEILKIATEYGIRIVPEIVAPGHNAAAIQAMHWYEKNNNDPQYRLTDPNQEEGGFSVQGFYDNVMNPCMDSTFKFLQKIVGQFKEDHEQYKHIQNHFHIGGDETNVGLIKGSPICRQKMKDEGLDHENDDDVNAYFHQFFQTYVKMVGEAGFHVHGWEEVWEYEESPDIFKIYDKSEWDVPAGIDLYAYHWNNMWLMGDGPTTGHMMANAGYKLIMSPATHLYLDHAQYEHPHSRGLMWATRSSNLTKVFSFRPFDFYRNGLTYIDGNKIDNGCEPGTTENGDSWDCYPLTEEGRKNVVGMEACLWSEEVVEEKHIWEQMFPRVFALAQRSWAETTWEETTGSSWDIFKNTTFKADWLRFRYALQFKLRELEQDDMWYDLPKPGMKEVDPDSNSWSFNTLYYHNPVMFRNPNSTDDSWKPYSIVKEEIKDNDDDNRNVEIVTTSFSKYSSGQPRMTSQPYQVTMNKSSAAALLPSLLVALIFFLH